ncbi:MAG: fluoride efflux transporter CrcB [Woeseiaceae bacterium]
MKQLLLVAVGGGLGAVARYKVGGLILHHTANWKFPLSTFVVNVSGCLLAGVLAAMIIKHDAFSADARLFLFTGLLGGFTTFSAFGLETVYLLQRHEVILAVLNVGLSTLAGVLILWLGIKAIP